jgi:predicted metallopeptidase
MIEYFPSPSLKNQIREIVELLRFDHVNLASVFCVRSKGSRSNRTIARIHGLSRIWQKVLGLESAYIIEIISERFDAMKKADQDKTLIHELLHIPERFGGGFRHHKTHVNRETVEVWYRRYQQKKRDLKH